MKSANLIFKSTDQTFYAFGLVCFAEDVKTSVVRSAEASICRSTHAGRSVGLKYRTRWNAVGLPVMSLRSLQLVLPQLNNMIVNHT